ncbi:MAG: hypothetical protein IJN05_12545, partial [Ruminococcus sp.]|nr:hypothetical protein [Ruminococcus sp.]
MQLIEYTYYIRSRFSAQNRPNKNRHINYTIYYHFLQEFIAISLKKEAEFNLPLSFYFLFEDFLFETGFFSAFFTSSFFSSSSSS